MGNKFGIPAEDDPARPYYEAAIEKGRQMSEAARRKASVEFVEHKYGSIPVPETLIMYAPPSYLMPDIKITYDQLEENIATLKKAIETLKSSWDGETKRNIDKINSSWAGKDCATYTSKLSNMDGKVQKTIQALELLCSTYEKARDMVASSQKQVTSAVDHLIN